MDQAVGKVLDALDRLQLADNTVVFFMSDNGGLSTSEGHPTSNLPLRAGKGWLYEGGIREPMIVRAPGITKPGTKTDSVVTSTDFFPTIVDLAALPARPRQHLDGRSFVALLGGEQRERGPVFWHYPHYGNQGGAPGGAIRDGDWKLIEWYEDDRLQLFNLARDVGEQHDLAESEPALRDRLRDQLRNWRNSVGAVMPAINVSR
jgi:arylsulfatase A-like enzyme